MGPLETAEERTRAPSSLVLVGLWSASCSHWQHAHCCTLDGVATRDGHKTLVNLARVIIEFI